MVTTVVLEVSFESTDTCVPNKTNSITPKSFHKMLFGHRSGKQQSKGAVTSSGNRFFSRSRKSGSLADVIQIESDEEDSATVCSTVYTSTESSFQRVDSIVDHERKVRFSDVPDGEPCTNVILYSLHGEPASMSDESGTDVFDEDMTLSASLCPNKSIKPLENPLYYDHEEVKQIKRDNRKAALQFSTTRPELVQCIEYLYFSEDKNCPIEHNTVTELMPVGVENRDLFYSSGKEMESIGELLNEGASGRGLERLICPILKANSKKTIRCLITLQNKMYVEAGKEGVQVDKDKLATALYERSIVLTERDRVFALRLAKADALDNSSLL